MTADHTKFYEVEARRNERELRILDCKMFVGKEPTKEKRIGMNVRMKLSGVSNAGAPEWLDNAYMYVAKNHDPIYPPTAFRGYDLEFGVDNLFGPKSVQANGCLMRAFCISEYGPAESPEVYVSFSIRMPFSTKRWNWFGQMGGEEVWVKFTPGEAGTGENTKGSDDDDDEAENGDLFDDAGDFPDEGSPAPAPKKAAPKKHGPKELKAYHAKKTATKKKSKTKK